MNEGDLPRYERASPWRRRCRGSLVGSGSFVLLTLETTLLVVVVVSSVKIFPVLGGIEGWEVGASRSIEMLGATAEAAGSDSIQCFFLAVEFRR